MSWSHRVQFYETDLMGIVHHSNYLRFFEEARVDWAHRQGFIDYQKPKSASHFAVLETRVRHLKPAFFGDLLKIEIRGRQDGAKFIFQYRLWRDKEWLASAETTHVALDEKLKPMRLPKDLCEKLEKEIWKETWL